MKALTTALALTCALTAVAADRPAPGEWRRFVVNGQLVFAAPPEAVRAAGLPWEDIPDAENAATYYLRAGEQPLEGPPEFLAATDEPWGPGWENFYAWFQGTDPIRRDLRAGAALPRCQFPWFRTTPGTLTLGNLAMPHLAIMRRLSALMAVEGNLARKQGRTRDALNAYLTALAMTRHVARQPSLIAGVSAVTMADGVIPLMRRTLDEDAPSAETLSWFAQSLADVESIVPDFTAAFLAEQSCVAKTFGAETWIELAEDNRALQLGPASEAFVRSRAFAVLFPDRTLRRDTEQAQSALLAPLAGSTWDAAAATRKSFRGGAQLGKDWNPFLKGLPYTMWRVHATDVVLLCDLRALRIEAALRRCKAARKEWPPSLAALVPEFIDNVPVDPFSGAPFVYRRAGESCSFYSVGPDAKDDAGKEGRKPQLYNGGDIIYTCEGGRR